MRTTDPKKIPANELILEKKKNEFLVSLEGQRLWLLVMTDCTDRASSWRRGCLGHKLGASSWCDGGRGGLQLPCYRI